jgi:hypothetical protein
LLSFSASRTEKFFAGQRVQRCFDGASSFNGLTVNSKGEEIMNPNYAALSSAPADENAKGGGESRGALAETKDKLARTARDAAGKIKATASDAATKAKDQAERLVGEKKETTATRLDDYSSAIHESARSLEEKDPNIAWFTHRAADRLQTAADYVRTRDFSGLRDDAERIARRHPAVFFGGMFLGGLLVGNLVKASRRKLDEENDRDERGELAASEAGADWMSSAPHAGESADAPSELPTSVPGTGI